MRRQRLGTPTGPPRRPGTATATSGGPPAWTPTPALSAGAGGQFIQVIPDLDLVVVITTDTDQDRSDPQLLIEGTIVSAIAH
jgi:hypothetical protein